MSLSSPEKGLIAPKSVEVQKLLVKQPAQMQTLMEMVDNMVSIDSRVREVTGEDQSGDLGGAGASGSTASGGSTTISIRDQAIATIPVQQVMQAKIEAHIKGEVRKLQKLASAVSRASGPGAAYRLNELYAKIRRLNTLLSELLEASFDVLKRLYIRIFIDEQPVL